jgi:hypothetical protein
MTPAKKTARPRKRQPAKAAFPPEVVKVLARDEATYWRELHEGLRHRHQEVQRRYAFLQEYVRELEAQFEMLSRSTATLTREAAFFQEMVQHFKERAVERTAVRGMRE